MKASRDWRTFVHVAMDGIQWAILEKSTTIITHTTLITSSSINKVPWPAVEALITNILTLIHMKIHDLLPLRGLSDLEREAVNLMKVLAEGSFRGGEVKMENFDSGRGGLPSHRCPSMTSCKIYKKIIRSFLFLLVASLRTIMVAAFFCIQSFLALFPVALVFFLLELACLSCQFFFSLYAAPVLFSSKLQSYDSVLIDLWYTVYIYDTPSFFISFPCYFPSSFSLLYAITIIDITFSFKLPCAITDEKSIPLLLVNLIIS